MEDAQRTIFLLALSAFVLSGGGNAGASPCRAEWTKYEEWKLGIKEHKVFASQKTKVIPGACFWWRSDDVEDATRRALEACNKWQADTCEVVSVDGKALRPNLNAYFSQRQYVPVSIEIYDAKSSNSQKLNGFALFEYPVRGDDTTVRLVSDKKIELCNGHYQATGFLSGRFELSGTCFKKFHFSNDVVATGYRYINGIKVGYSFEAKFEFEGSFVRVASQ